MKTKKHLLGILLTLVLVLGMIPGMGLSVHADTQASNSTTWSEDIIFNDTVTIDGGVTVSADITVTISEGRSLTVKGGIEASGHTLTVRGPGELIVYGSDGREWHGSARSGPGGSGINGNVIFIGSNATVRGGHGGIGSEGAHPEGLPGEDGGNGGPGGSGINGVITVKGGTVTVIGGDGGNGGEGGWAYPSIERYKGGNGGKGATGGTGVIGSVYILGGGHVTISGGAGGTGGRAGYPREEDRYGHSGNGGIGIDGTLTVYDIAATVSGGNGGPAAEPILPHEAFEGSNGRAVTGNITALSAAEESDNNSTWYSISGSASDKQFVRGEGVAHNHRFSYSTNGATITATCANYDRMCPLDDGSGKCEATLTVSATDAVYTGSAYTGASISALEWIAYGLAVPEILYEGRGSTSYPRNTTPPSDAGTYRALIAMDKDNTAVADFEITPMALTIIGTSATNRAYEKDNTAVTINFVRFQDSNGKQVSLKLGEEYTAAGTMSNPDAGDGKQVDVTVTLISDNYTLAENKATGRVNISKAANPATVTETASVESGGKTVDLEKNVKLNGATGAVDYAIIGENKGCSLNGSVLTSGGDTGSVTVNVTVAEDGNYKALTATPITVSIYGGAISLDKTSASLNVNDKVALIASINSADTAVKTVKWSASSGNVALYLDENCTKTVGTEATSALTVYVKGVSEGAATVTVASNADISKTASCNVTVNSVHNHDNIVFRPWISTDSLPTSGNYYLTGNVAVSSETVVSDTLNLCLNGYGIIMANGGSVYVVPDGKEMHLYDCNSSGRTNYVRLDNYYGTGVSEKPGPVPVNGTGVAAVNGGFITGGRGVPEGGGAFRVSGTFAMHGGTLLGNHTSSDTFGGAILSSGSTTISGNSRITYNSSAGNRSGVYVSSGTFNISGAPDLTGNRGCDIVLTGNDRKINFTDFSSSVRLGVIYYTGNPASVTITSGAKFASDDEVRAAMTYSSSNREIYCENGQAKITSRTSTVYYVKQNADGSWPADASSADIDIVSGLITTFKPDKTYPNYSLSGWSKEYKVSEAERNAAHPGATISVGEETAELYLYYSLESRKLVFYEDSEGKKIWKTVPVKAGSNLKDLEPTVDSKGVWTGEYQLSSRNNEVFTFTGWAKEPGVTAWSTDGISPTEKAFDWNQTMPSQDVNIYPVWVTNYINVRLDLGAYDEVAVREKYDWYDVSRYDRSTPAIMDPTQARSFWKSTNLDAATSDRDRYVNMAKMNAATRTGYTLAGWYNRSGMKWEPSYLISREYGDKDASGKLNLTYSVPYRNYGYALTLTAGWKLNDASVVYDVGSGTGSIVDAKTYAVGSEIAVSGEKPTPPKGSGSEVYEFEGWKDSKGKLYRPGDKIAYNDESLITAFGAANEIKLTAVYKKIAKNSLVFDSQGGSYIEPIVAAVGTVVSLKTIEEKRPERIGYTFDGWYKESSCVNKVSEPITIKAEATTIYAKWNVNRYTLTFDSKGGTPVDSITQDYDTPVTAPANPTRTGYVFTGWDKTVPARMPAGDMTFNALWKVGAHTVTYDTDGGSSIETEYRNYGEYVEEPAVPTKDGYTFIHWVYVSGETVSFPFTMPDEDVILKAVWKENQTESVDFTAVAEATKVTIYPVQQDAEYIIVYHGYTPWDEDWENSRKPGSGESEIVFEGLVPNTAYDIYGRRRASEGKMPSEPVMKTVTTLKAEQAAPDAPYAEAVSDTEVLVYLTQSGAEYTIVRRDEAVLDDAVWTSPDEYGLILFENLERETDYYVYARMKETDRQYPSAPSAPTAVTTMDAPPEEGKLIYNGAAQYLVEPGTVEGGTIYYALGVNETEVPTAWSTDVPKGTNAGDYYVWFKVEGDDNHTDVPPMSMTVTIHAKRVSVAAKPQTVRCGESIKQGTDQATLIDEVPGHVLSAVTLTAAGTKITPSGAGIADAAGSDVTANYTIRYIDGTLEDLDDREAKAVEALINDLPDPEDVTYSDKAAIAAVKKQYDALSDVQKSLVSDAAKEKLQKDIEAAEADDRRIAKSFMDAVNAVPGKPAGTEKGLFEKASAIYNEMTDDQKALVTAAVMKLYNEEVEAFRRNHTFKYANAYYKVLSNGDVTYLKPSSRSIPSATVPNEVQGGKFRYRVIKVSNNAFRNCKNLKWVVISENVYVLGRYAFARTDRLETVKVMGSNFRSGKVTDAFFKAGKNRKLTVKAPKGKVSAYSKLFKNEGRLNGKVIAAS